MSIRVQASVPKKKRSFKDVLAAGMYRFQSVPALPSDIWLLILRKSVQMDELLKEADQVLRGKFFLIDGPPIITKMCAALQALNEYRVFFKDEYERRAYEKELDEIVSKLRAFVGRVQRWTVDQPADYSNVLKACNNLKSMFAPSSAENPGPPPLLSRQRAM